MKRKNVCEIFQEMLGCAYLMLGENNKMVVLTVIYGIKMYTVKKTPSTNPRILGKLVYFLYLNLSGILEDSLNKPSFGVTNPRERSL